MFTRPRHLTPALAIAAAALSFAAPAARAQPAPAPSLALEARAQQLYQQGRGHFLAGEFEAARGDFQASLDTVDSPNTRMYLGRALLRLGRVAEAWVMFDRASRDAAERAVTEPRYTPTRDSARAEAESIAPRVAWLLLELPAAPDDAVVFVNGHPVQRAALGVAMPMNPGALVVEARARGYRDARREATLTAGERESVTIALEALPAERADPPGRPQGPRAVPVVVTPPPQGLGTLAVTGLVTAITGVAAVAAGAGFGLAAQNIYDELDARRMRDEPVDVERADEGERDRDLANGLLIGGGAVAVAGVVMLTMGLRGRAARAPAVTLLAGPGVGVGGSF